LQAFFILESSHQEIFYGQVFFMLPEERKKGSPAIKATLNIFYLMLGEVPFPGNIACDYNRNFNSGGQGTNHCEKYFQCWTGIQISAVRVLNQKRLILAFLKVLLISFF
jgi:hypothetical protein